MVNSSSYEEIQDLVTDLLNETLLSDLLCNSKW
jgi:hypothetical protein